MPNNEVRTAIEWAIAALWGYNDPPGSRTTESVRELVRCDLHRLGKQIEVLANEEAVVRMMDAVAEVRGMRAALLALARECKR